MSRLEANHLVGRMLDDLDRARTYADLRGVADRAAVLYQRSNLSHQHELVSLQRLPRLRETRYERLSRRNEARFSEARSSVRNILLEMLVMVETEAEVPELGRADRAPGDDEIDRLIRLVDELLTDVNSSSLGEVDKQHIATLLDMAKVALSDSDPNHAKQELNRLVGVAVVDAATAPAQTMPMWLKVCNVLMGAAAAFDLLGLMGLGPAAQPNEIVLKPTCIVEVREMPPASAPPALPPGPPVQPAPEGEPPIV